MRLLFVTLLLLPLASAGQLEILHDVNDSGLTFVGNLDRFGFALLENGVPAFHQDVEFTIRQGGVVLSSTKIPAGHDYDGVGSYGVSFPTTGDYEVEATWGAESRVFRGSVLAQPSNRPELVVNHAKTAELGTAIAFQLDLKNLTERIAHTDILVQIFESGQEVLRTQTHTHGELQEFSYVAPKSGSYSYQFTGFKAFPGQASYLFPAAVSQGTFTITEPAPPLLPMLELPIGEEATTVTPANRVVKGTNGPNSLVGTFDPYDAVGVGQAIRLNAIVLDANGKPVPHVDFEATLSGPNGVLFSSKTLHEYDGLLEFLDRRFEPGQYAFEVIASQGDWSDNIELIYNVVTRPVLPAATLTMMDGGSDSCTARNLTFTAVRAGQPFAHSEVFATIMSDENIVRDAKLHTHGDGKFSWMVGGLPTGNYTVNTQLQATEIEQTGASAKSFPLTVTGCEMKSPVGVKGTPMIGLPLVLAALVLARKK